MEESNLVNINILVFDSSNGDPDIALKKFNLITQEFPNHQNKLISVNSGYY